MTDQGRTGDADKGAAVWSEPDPDSPPTGDVIESHALFKLQTEREERLAIQNAQTEARRHFMKMQLNVLFGIGLIFVVTMLTLVIGLWRHLVPVDFGTELMRMVIPTVLGAGLTIVGAFFRDGGGSKSG